MPLLLPLSGFPLPLIFIPDAGERAGDLLHQGKGQGLGLQRTLQGGLHLWPDSQKRWASEAREVSYVPSRDSREHWTAGKVPQFPALLPASALLETATGHELGWPGRFFCSGHQAAPASVALATHWT